MSDVICFVYPKELPAAFESPKSNISGMPQIMDMLVERDLRPVLSAHAEAAFGEKTVAAVEPRGKGYGPAFPPRTYELSAVGALHSRLNRSIKKERLPEAIELPPTINDNATRSLAFRKARMHEEVLEPLSLGVPTHLVTSVEDVEVFLAEQSAKEIIVKPNSGYNSIGVQRIGREAVRELFEGNQNLLKGGSLQILQPAYDFTKPFPTTLKPYDKKSQPGFERWTGSDLSKEVRVYGFHSPQATEVFPVARAIDNDAESGDKDKWFFIDPDSVPETLLEDTQNIMQRAALVSGAIGLYGSVDYGYDGDWRIIEVNARMPYMIGYSKHQGVADVLRTIFADQLLAVAESRDKVKS